MAVSIHIHAHACMVSIYIYIYISMGLQQQPIFLRPRVEEDKVFRKFYLADANRSGVLFASRR